MYPIIGDTVKQEYNLSLAFFICVVICIPIFLYVKPCMVFCRKSTERDNNMIEFTDLNGNQAVMDRGDDNMNEGGGMQESINREASGGDMMAERVKQMKSLDQQL